MEQKKFIARNSVAIFATRIAAAGINLLTGIILARELGPIGRGEYALIILLPGLLSLASDLGIGSANIFFVGKKKYSYSEIFSGSIVMAFCLSIIAIIISWMVMDTLHPLFFKNIPVKVLRLVCLITPFMLVNGYTTNILVGMLKIKYVNLNSMLQAVLMLSLSYFLLVVLKTGVYGAVAVWGVTQFILMVVTVMIFLHFEPKGFSFSFKREMIKDTVSFGVKGYLSNLASFFNYRIDMFLVSFFLSAAAVGHYAVSVAIAEMVWYIPNSMATVFYPVVTKSGKKDAGKITGVVTRQMLLITALVCLFILFTGKYIILTFFGKDFASSVWPFILLLPGILSISLAKILSGYFCGIGKPEIPMAASVISFVSNVTINLFLIPKYGIAGAALTSAVSYTLEAIILLFYYTRISGLSAVYAVIPKLSDLAYYRDLRIFKK
ncbi:MAG: hypothetical protein A2452_13140 [Candidatus Firestonebacteria bacterium RIFOXYC2_FULL_39_67]|nr:MAG: hypothetical protein A2536_03225 [Candidatus Firestonebacteria bacterium RIFOXYD2_FULL_39_29]OGF52084.1 MAG: hypothetical protein A2497_00870 [Candidatus Firestonebacteria bacterium RifOxyC12_full_39_7]OGF56264.1 MAG: hypothetical protein A2452_13140 [Candidatus Firestonebacteria bacterium RIFOXYC2_FULL_39_67]